jgi:hypothetical protein
MPGTRDARLGAAGETIIKEDLPSDLRNSRMHRPLFLQPLLRLVQEWRIRKGEQFNVSY